MSRVAIITTYHYDANLQWLDEAVRSADAQTFKDFVDVTVYDPFNDRARALDDACNQVNDTEYLGLLDADDQLHPECLAKCVAVMDANPSASFVYTDSSAMKADGTIIPGPEHFCHSLNTPANHMRGFTTGHFRLMRRSLFDAVGGFDPTFQTCMDYDLCLKLEEVGPVIHLPEILYYKRQHAGQISALRSDQQQIDAGRAVENSRARRANHRDPAVRECPR